MTGFTSISHYLPSLVFLAGAFTIAGILGIGNRIGRALRLPQPWMTTVGAVAAIEMLTLAVEAVAMAQIATRTVLIAIWALFCVCGAAFLWRTAASAVRTAKGPPLKYIAAPIAILIFNLLIALCPSTKVDEVYYHMIVPGRIVQDGGLLFYREPMRAAIYPQMAFQMGFAPFHALALPDAGNVVSWFFGALLVWFTYTLIEKATGSRLWAAIFGAAIVAGLYTTVWHVTSGAHAIGDVAVTAAVIAIYTIDAASSLIRPSDSQGGRGPSTLETAASTPLAPRSGERVAGGRVRGDAARVAMSIGILVAAFASTKVFFFPLALAIALIALVRLGWKSFAFIATVPLLFMAPLMIWTAIHAGSPLGPLLEGSAGHSPYFPNEVRAFVDDYVAGPRGPIPDKLRNEAVNFSPILWIAIAAFILLRRHIAVRPSIGIALLALQIVVILGWNTYDARYLGGVHYALMILFAMFLSASMRNRILAARWFNAAAILLIVPWMLIQIAYGAQFMKLILHLETKEQFLERYIPLYRDFATLDRALPRDATLLSIPGLASIYAPRALYYHVLDVPSRGPAFLVSYDPTDAIDLHGRFTAGEEIYVDRAAVIATFRTPGKQPQLGTLRVRRLR